MQEPEHIDEHWWEIENRKGECDDMIGEDDGEVDVPGFLRPFLNMKMIVLFHRHLLIFYLC